MRPRFSLLILFDRELMEICCIFPLSDLGHDRFGEIFSRRKHRKKRKERQGAWDTLLCVCVTDAPTYECMDVCKFIYTAQFDFSLDFFLLNIPTRRLLRNIFVSILLLCI